jgi:hypothetical protein
LAGCSSTTAGSPVPHSEDSSSPQSTKPEELAPRVENPKDLRGVDSCELLNAAQKTELAITTPGETLVTEWGEEECSWQNSALSVALAPDTRRDGLEEAYRRRTNFDNFAESTVDGYPAVRVNFFTQGCSVFVGVADDQVLFVDFGRVTGKDPALRDPCGFAENVAGMVLANLPAA